MEEAIKEQIEYGNSIHFKMYIKVKELTVFNKSNLNIFNTLLIFSDQLLLHYLILRKIAFYSFCACSSLLLCKALLPRKILSNTVSEN